VQNSRATSIPVKTERLIQALRYYYQCPAAKRRPTCAEQISQTEQPNRATRTCTLSGCEPKVAKAARTRGKLTR
jgi:hypothetical protein